MDYLKIHNLIIERAKQRTPMGYMEKHHIIPKCMGGTDDLDNIVSLTAREHFVIHKLLTHIYPTNHKLHYAVWIMATMRNAMGRDYKIGAREYEKLKVNRVITDDTRKRMSQSHIGKVHPKSTIDKMRAYKKTDEWKIKVSKSLSLYERTETHSKNISEGLKGIPNWSLGLKNRWTEQQIIQNRKNQPTIRSVNQYNKNGEFIKTWDSITQATKLYSGVWHCLHGKQKTSGGYIWKYADIPVK